MPANTSDQQITYPIGTDAANNPVAFTDMLADVEGRLVLKYTNDADRAARHTAPIEGDLTHLATENRYDTYNGSAYVSTFPRTLWTVAERVTDATAINNSIALVNDSVLTSTLPTAGRFNWDLVLFYDSSVTADLRLAMTWPAGVTLARWGTQGLAAGAAASTGDGQFGTATTSTGIIALGGAGVGTIVVVHAQGTLTMGGTGGAFIVTYAQNTLDATNTTIRSGSRLHMWKTT